MSQNTKRLLGVLAGLAALALLLAALAPRLLGANVRSRIEARASAALGMRVAVAGRVALRFFPGLHVTVTDLSVDNGGAEIATIGELQLGIGLRSLLHKDLQVQDIRFRGAKFSIARDKSGRFNFARPARPDSGTPTAEIAAVSFADSSLIYTDARFGNEFSAAHCDVTIDGVQLAARAPPDLMRSLAFKGELACAELHTKNLRAANIRAVVQAAAGTLTFAPIALTLFGGRGSAAVAADFSAPEPIYHVRASIAKLQIAELSSAVGRAKIASGVLDFDTDLSMHGSADSELLRTAAGEASLHGDNLVLEIGDLDEEFSRYESTQTLNLVDVAAFFLAGPLGVAVTKGYDYARALKQSPGRTTIRMLRSEWKVVRGIAQAQDVALATPQNRLVMRGALDLVSESYDDVTVALVDARGCARVEQKIHGSFGKPDVEKPNVVMALAGPARKLINKGKRLLGAKCPVFYSGAVPPPA